MFRLEMPGMPKSIELRPRSLHQSIFYFVNYTSVLKKKYGWNIHFFKHTVYISLYLFGKFVLRRDRVWSSRFLHLIVLHCFSLTPGLSSGSGGGRGSGSGGGRGSGSGGGRVEDGGVRIKLVSWKRFVVCRPIAVVAFAVRGTQRILHCAAH